MLPPLLGQMRARAALQEGNRHMGGLSSRARMGAPRLITLTCLFFASSAFAGDDVGNWWDHGVPGASIDLPSVVVKRVGSATRGASLVFSLSGDNILRIERSAKETLTDIPWPVRPTPGYVEVLTRRLRDILERLGLATDGKGASHCRMVIYAPGGTPWMAIERLLKVAADRRIAMVEVDFCAARASGGDDHLMPSMRVITLPFQLPWDTLTGRRPIEARSASMPPISVRLSSSSPTEGSTSRQDVASLGPSKYRIPQELPDLVAAIKRASRKKVGSDRSEEPVGMLEVASDIDDASLTYESVLKTYAALCDVSPSKVYFTRFAPWEAAPHGEVHEEVPAGH